MNELLDHSTGCEMVQFACGMASANGVLVANENRGVGNVTVIHFVHAGYDERDALHVKMGEDAFVLAENVDHDV